YERINIGDVGYIYQGSFHRLFNPTLPLRDPRNIHLPRNFVRLDLGRAGITNALPRFPSILHTGNINSQNMGVAASASGP
ncbi:hypothetical protein BU17DRAFT_57169, partial [Hysterangium stoloniferum]